jgi:hypothetical protein
VVSGLWMPDTVRVYSRNLVNIGNARLYGLEEDLGLGPDQYQLAVGILFVTYCVCFRVRCNNDSWSNPPRSLKRRPT